MDALHGKHVLLGVTGSIAAYKAPLLVRELVAAGATVRALTTRSAGAFVTELTLEALTGRSVMTSALELTDGRIPHVEEAYAADLVVLAPATANSLAKLAAGLADEALYATLLSYDGPLVIAPAMESRMWAHPATQANIAKLVERGAIIVNPEDGALASGRTGPGRLAGLDKIMGAARAALGPRDLEGERVLITAGPTAEDLDPVRYLTNRSSGRMGVALAARAAARGAEVVLVHGPILVPVPAGVRAVATRSAQQMHDAVMREVDEGMDLAILAAAVADWRPAEVAPDKLKKGDDEVLSVGFVRTPDILAALGKRERRPVLIGFAAETTDVANNARKKLAKKGCDAICANDVSAPGTGFQSPDNDVTVHLATGEARALGHGPKEAIADGILEVARELLDARAV